MLVVDLHCAHGHHFEGWFASAEDLASQKERGLLSCPVCGDHDVVRRPSAPHLHTSGLREQAAAAPLSSRSAPHSAVPSSSSQLAARPVKPGSERPVHDALPAEAQEAMAALQAFYLKAVRHVVANTEDVGERFADEARSMHHGDAPERAIRGRASEEDKQALREEGIDFLSMPIPDHLKDTLQ